MTISICVKSGDADKLKRFLEVKQRQKQEAMHIEDTQD